MGSASELHTHGTWKVRSCCKEEVLTRHIKEGAKQKEKESKRKTLECNHLGDECCNVFFDALSVTCYRKWKRRREGCKLIVKKLYLSQL